MDDNKQTQETKQLEQVDMWLPTMLSLLAFPKYSSTDMQVAELKGRVDTLEKIVLKKED